jgi:hypothetical protein
MTWEPADAELPGSGAKSWLSSKKPEGRDPATLDLREITTKRPEAAKTQAVKL